MSSRPSWDEYFLHIAQTVSTRSSCERSKVGAVVVAPDKRVRGTGYNDAPAGKPGCESCPRRSSGVEPGSDYRNCVALHAEMNALLYCDRRDLVSATLYVTRSPCADCIKAISGAGIARVVTPDTLREAGSKGVDEWLMLPAKIFALVMRLVKR